MSLTCPFCTGAATTDDGDCGHLLLRVDETFREPQGGALHEAFLERWRHACDDDDSWGDAEDDEVATLPRVESRVLSRPRRPVDEADEFQALQDEVDALAQHETREDDDGGPGDFSSLVSYWVRDPAAVPALEERLLDGPERPTDRVSEATLRHAWVDGVLGAVGRAAVAQRWPATPLQCSLPLVGQAYDGGLMVVGRGVHDGRNGIRPSALADEGRANAWAWQLEHDRDAGDDCPLAWVARQWDRTDPHENPRRQAFWRVLHGVAHGLRLGDADDWSSHLACSALHKVTAPPGWPQPARLREAQQAGAARLDRKSTRLNSSHSQQSRMPSSA